MPIDAYSLCPGGSGKKIKFCCGDLLGELQKIERMLEGEQGLACLGLIDRLEGQHPGRACLLAIKGLVLRSMGRWEEAQANAATFLQAHPGNPSALAESAIAAAAGRRGREAMRMLQRAMAACGGNLQSRVHEAMGIVAQGLLVEEQWMAARALLRLQAAIDREDEEPLAMLMALNRMAGVPLLLKDDLPAGACPDDAPWKDRFEESLAPVRTGDWLAAVERLAGLAGEVADAPAIWRSLAVVRGRLADTVGCIEALRRFASMDVPLEEAAEAEALAMLLTEVPLGDPLEVLSATWTVKDAELLQAALTLDGRVLGAGPGQASADEEGSPPPRALLAIFDRPLPEKDDDLYPETVSRLVGKAMLFGRQTDREARLEVNDVTREDLRQIRDLLAEVAGDAIDAEPAEEEVTGRVSASQRLLQRNWRLPGNMPAGQFDALVAAHMRDALLNSWPELELGVLDGKSARQVAGEQSYRLKLLAAVLVLQSWAELTPGEFDFNLLRAELGLPVLEPIDPREVDIERLPLVRLSRVMTEKASDEALRVGYRRAMVFSAAEALEKFARAIVDRDSLAGDEVQIQSYRTLAELERDSEKALEHLERGRSAAESAGMSSAFWDVMELTMRFARREGDRVGWLMEHIQREHIEEPDVAEVLAQFLVSVGVIRPDGTPAGKGARQDRPAAAEPGTGDKVGLWTPGNEGAGGGKKIWLPG